MTDTVRTVLTTCPYCGTGCGVKAEVAADGAVTISGDPDHPANFGRLCVKGAALAETLGHDGRLLHPEIAGRRVTWNAALDAVASRFAATIAEHGPDSVALYVSGQILTEDYYVANKLMKGFVGSANIDTNSRLCMASSVAGHKRAFGSDTVPGCYEDLDSADLVVLTGSNLAWCHPILYQRIAAAKAARPAMKVVNIDPRLTATDDIADLHLGLEPGSDVALFAGLLAHLEGTGHRDGDFVAAHTSGLDAALAAAASFADLDAVARATGLAPADIATFYGWFGATEKTVTVYSQGVNQSSAGTDKVNAIVNCHLLTGRIGREGMGPFSVTGQPNAMGGREVGGLANQLAAHLELDDPAHRALVQDFWGSPTIAATPGHKAVELFEAVADGRIKALWIMATNPVDSLPDADRVRAALRSCPFVVVSDVVRDTDTTALADVLLPAEAWGEKDGTVTNSERRITRQRRLVAPAGEARPDWWALAHVGRRLGWTSAFAWDRAAAVFREHAALSGHRPEIVRDFDISGFADLSDEDFATLAPFQWPRRTGEPAPDGPKRFFADGRFFTPDGRGRLIATHPRPPRAKPSPELPFWLNTGRVRDQWHTMTRTGLAPKLTGHIAEPFAEIADADAERLGIAPASLVTIANGRAAVVVRALVTDRQRPGSVFVPIHWTDRVASSARIGALIAPETDPLSGQPESKAATVAVRPFAAVWYGFALTRTVPKSIAADYWALGRIDGGTRLELAGLEAPDDWSDFAVNLFGPDVELVHFADAKAGRRRIAAVRDGAVVGLLLVAPTPVEAARDWLCQRFSAAIPAGEAAALLAARPGGAAEDPGRRVCTCYGVGANQIRKAAVRGCRSVAAIGDHLAAGTNCGSCRPEIARIVAAVWPPEAAVAAE
ncbi:nitrate reductase [Siculibacillus lacustris]|uniref:Nitrate reductase n=1 Tax=Siculibacillus lacustris TaxID=1549641 RepID=A0A4Q9VT73_9HYPH|nr:nitrate reductase [Siculibacillus lacustris]TBW38281.1 nitrate reductase [Siculibacillus lacustris]